MDDIFRRIVAEKLVDGGCQLERVALERRLGTDPAWKAAYRVALARRLGKIYLTRWTPGWSMNTVPEGEDVGVEEPVARASLASGRDVVVFGHAKGTLWWVEGEEYFFPFEEAVRVEIPGLGQLCAEVEAYVPPFVEDAWHGLIALREVASWEGWGWPRAGKAARIVAEWLSAFEGPLLEAYAQGHEAFEKGWDTEAELERLIDYGLEARLLLSDIVKTAVKWGVGEDFPECLQEVDRLFKPYESAVFLSSTCLGSGQDIFPPSLSEWFRCRERVSATLSRRAWG